MINKMDEQTYPRVMDKMERVLPKPLRPGQKEAMIENARKLLGDEVPLATVLETVEKSLNAPMYANSMYTVHVNEDMVPMDESGTKYLITHLSIKRNDKAPIHDWRHFQQIKNDICGPEREAVEIYPAESRLVDSANQYHLWVVPEGEMVPLGFFSGRRVMNESDLLAGSIQRAYKQEQQYSEENEERERKRQKLYRDLSQEHRR